MITLLTSLYCLLSCNNPLFWFSLFWFFSVFFFFERVARSFLEWISIMGELEVILLSLYLAKKKYTSFLEALHPTAANHYCLPKCTKLARKQMFPITNDIYQLVSGIGLLQNWSSLEVTVMTHYWISQSFQSEKMQWMIWLTLTCCIFCMYTSTITFIFPIRHFFGYQY